MNKEEIERYKMRDYYMIPIEIVDSIFYSFEQENQELKNKIKKLIKYGYGTNMTLGEFKEFYKLATGKDYDPKKCPEVE